MRPNRSRKLGPLLLEEGPFLFLTMLLLGCGITLLVSPESHRRLIAGRVASRAATPRGQRSG